MLHDLEEFIASYACNYMIRAILIEGDLHQKTYVLFSI